MWHSLDDQLILFILTQNYYLTVAVTILIQQQALNKKVTKKEDEKRFHLFVVGFLSSSTKTKAVRTGSEVERCLRKVKHFEVKAVSKNNFFFHNLKQVVARSSGCGETVKRPPMDHQGPWFGSKSFNYLNPFAV